MNIDDYETLPHSNTVTHMTAGAIAGVMEHCVMYPLDSVKTRMQSLSLQRTDGIMGTLAQMVRKEGILRPVRGMSAMVVGAGPSHALYFSTYEYLKNVLVQHTSTARYHTVIYGISGCASTLLHDGIMNPAEVVKQRMQMLHSPYKSAVQCFASIYRCEGPSAFYRSYTTQLTMNVPFQSIHFMVYEAAQKLTNPDGSYNPKAHVISGALAGAIAAAITTPLDVCKTLLNTQPQQVGVTVGLVDAVKKVYVFGGALGYFRGLRARVMYQMPATAICWSTYEFFKYVLGKTGDVALVSPTVVLAEATEPTPTIGVAPSKTSEGGGGIKPRELPAMSGAGLYGAISFNTMHTDSYNSSSSNNNRNKDSLIHS